MIVHGFARVYAGQLERPEALAQIAQLRSLAAWCATSVLCFEREPSACHRSLLVAAALPEPKAQTLFAGVASFASRQKR